MDRGHSKISVHDWTDYEISIYADFLLRLPLEYLKKYIAGIEHSSFFIKSINKIDNQYTKRQIKNILEKIRGISNDLNYRKFTSERGRPSYNICQQNKNRYVNKKKRANHYKRIFNIDRKATDFEIKRAKYLCDTDVILRFAVDKNYKSALATITPSGTNEYELNPHYNEGQELYSIESTAEIIKNLKEAFQRFTKKLRNQKGQKCFGYYVIERQKNGKPHLHGMIFFPPEKERKIKKAFDESVQSQGAGRSDLSMCHEKLSHRGNKGISYLLKEIGNEETSAMLSMQNGVAVRQFSTFGLKLKTNLFDTIYRNINSLNNKAFQELHNLISDKTLKPSYKKYIFIRDFIKNLRPITKVVGGSRKSIVGIEDLATGNIVFFNSRNIDVLSNESKSKSSSSLHGNRHFKLKLTSNRKEVILHLEKKLSNLIKGSHGYRVSLKEPQFTCVTYSFEKESVIFLSSLINLLLVYSVFVPMLAMQDKLTYSIRDPPAAAGHD